MSSKNIMTFINAFKRQKEIEAFQKEVQEAGGIEISKARKLVQESNLESKQQAEMFRMIDDWKAKGFVINDIPEEWKSFKERTKAQGRYAVTKTEWNAMTDLQRAKYLSHSHATLYDDSHLKPQSPQLIQENIQKKLVDMEVHNENYEPFYREGSPHLEKLKESQEKE